MATAGVGGGVWHRRGSRQDLRPPCRRKPAEVADPRSVTEDVPQSFSIIPKTCLEKDGEGWPAHLRVRRREGTGVLQGSHSDTVPPLLPRVHTCACAHTHTLALHPGHQITPQQLQENSMELAHR